MEIYPTPAPKSARLDNFGIEHPSALGRIVSLLRPAGRERNAGFDDLRTNALSPYLTTSIARYPPSTESSTGTLFRVACE